MRFEQKRRVKRPHLASAGSLLLLGTVAVVALYLLFPRGMRSAWEGNQYKPGALSIAYLQAMVRSAPADTGLRLELARELLDVGRWQEAEPVLAQFRSNDAAQILKASLLRLRIRAAHLASLPVDDPQSAVLRVKISSQLKIFAKHAYEANPQVWELLFKSALIVNRPDLAAHFAKILAVKQPQKAADWWLKAGRWDLAAGKPLDAAEDYMHARPKTGDDLAVLQALSAARQAGSIARARALEIAREALQRYPNNPGVYESAITLAQEYGGDSLALRWNSKLLARYPRNPRTLRRQRDLALATNDLKAALYAGRRLLRMGDMTLHDRVVQARVEEWLGHVSAAEKQWHWLALHRGTRNDHLEWARLARMNYDYPELAYALDHMQQRFGLNTSQRDELENTYLVLGEPNKAQDVLSRYIRRHPHDRSIRIRLARLQVYDEQTGAAIKTLQAIGDRFGMTPEVRLALMRLHWQHFEMGPALSYARAAMPGFGSASDYELAIAGELGWRNHDDELMKAAYERLWLRPTKDPLATERLALAALQRGDLETAVLWAERGWRRYQDGSLMVRILPATVDAGRWDLARAMLSEVGSKLDQHLEYWLVSAEVASHDGHYKLSVADYKQALAIAPGSPTARAGLLWSLIALNDVDELRMYLHGWADDAREESGLWAAYAAGYLQLGEYSKALAFYDREMRLKPHDFLAALDYAQALERAGYVTEAWRMRNYALQKLRPQILAELDHVRPAASTAAVIDLSRRLEGTPQGKRWLLRALSAQPSQAAAAQLVSWYLAEDRPDVARRWMLSQALDGQALPAWQRLAVAVAHEDLPTIERLLREGSLDTSDRVLAQRTLGRRATALNEALQGIGQGGGVDDAALREAAASLSAELPNFVDLGVDARRIGELDISTMFADGALSRSDWTLKTRYNTSRLSADPSILNLSGARMERNGMLGLTLNRLRDRWHVAAGKDVLDAHDLVQWDLGYDYIWNSRLLLSVNYARNALSDASEQLRAGGARDSLTLSLNANYGARLFTNLSVSHDRYHSRAGSPLGQGYSAEWQLGQQLWVGTNRLSVSLSGSMMDNQRADALPADLVSLLPAGAQVGDVVPGQYRSAGLSFNLARGDPLGVYPDVASPRYALGAWTGWTWPDNRMAWEAEASVASRVLGSDDLRLAASYGTGSASGQVRAQLMLTYRWFFGR